MATSAAKGAQARQQEDQRRPRHGRQAVGCGGSRPRQRIGTERIVLRTAKRGSQRIVRRRTAAGAAVSTDPSSSCGSCYEFEY